MQTCLWHAATPALACTSCRLPLHSMQLGCSARHMTSVLPCGVASLSLFQITALPRCRGARLAAQIAAAHALALTLPCPALYCLSRAGLAAELGLSQKEFSEVFASGLAVFSAEENCVFIPNFIKYQGCESLNVLKSWVNQLQFIPHGKTKEMAVSALLAFVDGKSAMP